MSEDKPVPLDKMNNVQMAWSDDPNKRQPKRWVEREIEYRMVPCGRNPDIQHREAIWLYDGESEDYAIHQAVKKLMESIDKAILGAGFKRVE